MTRIKQKLAKLKKQIADHQDEILIVTCAIEAVIGVGLAIFYQDKYLKEKHLHRECHGYADWVVRSVMDGEAHIIRQYGETTNISGPVDVEERIEVKEKVG